jgi:FMN-dependent NADH-azoreductase
MSRKILGIVGSYRKNGVIDTLVSAALSAAQEYGAETEKVYLIDKHIEFCTNCRTCTQEAGTGPGACIHHDDMKDILDRYLKSDGVVLGAPVNVFNVNAVTRKFMERLACFAFWPWGQHGPAQRMEYRGKNAVLITSSAMPAFMGRFFTGALRALKIAARTMGAKPIASLFVGTSAQTEKPDIPDKALRRAHEAGRRLAVS